MSDSKMLYHTKSVQILFYKVDLQTYFKLKATKETRILFTMIKNSYLKPKSSLD